MPTVDTCSTPAEGWEVAHHLIGTHFRQIRRLVEEKHDRWNTEVKWSQKVLTIYLERIARRMAEKGHTVDGKAIWQIAIMSNDLDLAELSNLKVIEDRINDSRNIKL